MLVNLVRCLMHLPPEVSRHASQKNEFSSYDPYGSEGETARCMMQLNKVVCFLRWNLMRQVKCKRLSFLVTPITTYNYHMVVDNRSNVALAGFKPGLMTRHCFYYVLKSCM